MKQYTSRTLKLISFLYLGFPISYIIFSALLFDVPARSTVRIMLSPLFLLVCVAAMIAGFGLHEMRRWAWHVFVAANVLVGYLNAIVVQDYGASHHKVLAFLASIAFLCSIIYRVAREVRVPYFFPKIRWWESNPRYRLSVASTIERRDGPALQGQILDLSMGGCFIKLKSELGQDEPVTVKFTVFGRSMSCEAVVVWRSQSTVTHPKGIGLKFTAQDRPQRRSLRLITRRLKQIASFYRTSRYLMNQEDFLKRLEEMENRSLDKLNAG